MALTGFIGRLMGRKSFEVLHVKTTTAIADNGFCIFSFGGVPVNGAAGTFATQAPKGSLLVDTVNGTIYQNTGTQAAPTWTAR